MIVVLQLALIVVLIWIAKKNVQEKKQIKTNLRKTNNNLSIIIDWLELKQEGIRLDRWLLDNSINRVAIYGFGVLGKALYQELRHSEIKVECIIDKNKSNIKTDINMVDIDNIPSVDAVIISVVNAYDEIENELISRFNGAIVSIEDIIYGVGIIV